MNLLLSSNNTVAEITNNKIIEKATHINYIRYQTLSEEWRKVNLHHPEESLDNPEDIERFLEMSYLCIEQSFWKGKYFHKIIPIQRNGELFYVNSDEFYRPILEKVVRDYNSFVEDWNNAYPETPKDLIDLNESWQNIDTTTFRKLQARTYRELDRKFFKIDCRVSNYLTPTPI